MQSFDDACMAPGVVEQLAALDAGNWQYEVEPTATSWVGTDGDDSGWIVGVALEVFGGDGGGVERIIQQWTLVIVDERHSVIEQIDTLDTDAVVAAGQAVVVEYLAHLAAGRYSDAAALLGEGGMSWPDRPDLAALSDAPDTHDDLADALEAWCDSGALCAEADSVAARADIRGTSAEVTATWGIDEREVTATFIAGDDEGQPTVVGLPPLTGEGSLAIIAEITRASTVVATLPDGRVMTWVDGRTSQIPAPLDAWTWSDGRFVYWAVYNGDEVPLTTAAALDGSIVCEAAGSMRSLRQRPDGSFVATVERDDEATRTPDEFWIPNYAVDCATGTSIAIDPVSVRFEGGGRTLTSVAGRTFTVHYDAEGNGDIENAEGISINGDDYAGSHVFSPDGTRVVYGEYGGGAGPHVTWNIAVRNTGDGSLLWRTELPRSLGNLEVTDQRVVVALPSREAEYDPWMNTELLAVFDASDGTSLVQLPTSIDFLYLGQSSG